MNHHTQGRTRLANSSSSFEGIYTLSRSFSGLTSEFEAGQESGRFYGPIAQLVRAHA